jgi:hypothetical protein
MDEIIIRPSTPEDRNRLQQATLELQEHEKRLHAAPLPGAEMADAYLAWMRRQMEASGAVFVAEQNGVFAGFAGYWIAADDSLETPDQNRCGYISDLYVAPEFRGRDIARRLLAAVEQCLAGSGINRLRIGTLAANEAARRVYEKAGFGLCEVVYEKPLGRPREIGGAKGPEPTRYGDWEHKGRCTDF